MQRLGRSGAGREWSLPAGSLDFQPGIAVSAILAGIFAWNDLLYAFILTPAEAARTAPTIVLSYLGGYEIPWPKVMASATLVCAPVILGGVAVHKYMAPRSHHGGGQVGGFMGFGHMSFQRDDPNREMTLAVMASDAPQP